MPLPSTSSPNARRGSIVPRARLGPGHELEELHVADGVEEVHHEEALLKLSLRPSIMSLDAQARGVRGHDGVLGREIASSLANSACLMSRRSMIASITRSQVAARAWRSQVVRHLALPSGRPRARPWKLPTLRAEGPEDHVSGSRHSARSLVATAPTPPFSPWIHSHGPRASSLNGHSLPPFLRLRGSAARPRAPRPAPTCGCTPPPIERAARGPRRSPRRAARPR
jgi:hypothetical protein